MSSETGLVAPDSDTPGLQGRMGVFDVMFTVVAYNAPAVVFFGFLPVAMLLGNGLGTPVTFLVVAAILALLGSGLLNVSAKMQRPGGFYSLVTAGLGKVAGLAVGFTALLVYLFALLGAYAIGGIGLSNLADERLNISGVPWWASALVMLVVVAVLGFLNIQFSARVLYVFLSLEFILILGYVVVVTIQGGAHGLSLDSFQPDSIFSGSLPIAALFAVLGFGGFEATVIFREEVRDPDRTITRATYGTIAVIGVTYALLAWTFVNAFGPKVIMDALGKDVVGAAGVSLRDYLGEGAFIFGSILLVTSSFALMLASHNVLTRYAYNFGKDGILPSGFGETHPRHGSPHKSSFVVTGVSLVGIACMTLIPVAPGLIYATTAGILAYGMVIMMTFVALAVGVFMLRQSSSAAAHAVSMFAVAALLGAALIFASVRFDLLSGLTGTPATITMASCWIVAIAGAVLALVLKTRRPQVYARIGREVS